MAISLQDQLLKAGLVDNKKAKKIKQEKRKQAKQTPKGQSVENEAANAAEQARADKAERDRELNRQKQAAQEEKALLAQVRQIIQTHRIDRKGGEESYQFADGKTIKKIYVTGPQFDQLSRGQVGIARLDEGYELIPRVIAEKLQQRGPEALVSLQDRPGSKQDTDEDDPYADYEIPDDLMW